MSKPERELRYQGGIELRESKSGKGPGTLAGYAVVWDAISDPICGMFVETFRSGSFDRSLKADDVLAVADHDEGDVLGRVAAGTLKLEADAKGLRFENDLPDTTLGRDLAVSVSRGDIRGMSFAFVALRDEWDLKAPMPVRSVLDADLYHVSYVSRPAYPATTVGLRSLEKAKAAAVPAAAPTEQPAAPPAPAAPDLSSILARLSAAEAF